ncbi:metallophosphoesterase [Deferribacter autotrophicus]|uniref:Metallophosphoesterase n=1 Tax=Deferribacter autotrophicus TaxID=500465 RepID=A0A5A8F6F0_9BACT|nr:metallophosphoesterase [Deferribacter autotrophicus]KAA0259380.1 metallophosphoesterase [Deferribacter autotrophicus]
MKLLEFTAYYLSKRKYFRIILIILVIGFWGWSEYGDLIPIKEHDLNFKSLQEIKARYKGGGFTFAVLGDNKNSSIFNYIINKLNQDKKLLFAIIGGDLVLYPTKETYQAFLKQRQHIEIPTLVLPGNHDVAFRNCYFYHKIFDSFYYSFTLGDTKFILLDNSNENNISDEQFYWLENELKNSQNLKYRFVFMHVPLWDPRDFVDSGVKFAHALKDSDFARKLEDLFIKYNVTILFESHIHGYYAFEKRGLKHIITGGAGAELKGTTPETNFYHYVRVNVSDKGVKTEVVKLDKTTTFIGLEKYWHTAKLYISRFGKIYFKQILLGFFIFILLLDGLLDYLTYRKRLK